MYKKYLFFIFLFFLLYIEDLVRIGPITLSNVWKIIIIIIFLGYSINKNLTKKGNKRLIKITFLFSLSLLINTNGIFAFQDVQEVLIFLVFPISYYSFYYLYKNRSLDKLIENLLFLSCFLVFTSIPFILGILKQTKIDIIEAEIYGLQNDIMVGFFKHPAIASKVFVCATLFIYIYALTEKKRFKKNILYAFCMIGSYCVYLSFTRTGWFMLLFGVIFLMVYKKNIKTYILRVAPLLFVLAISLVYVYNTNDSVKRRLNADRIGRENSQVDQASLLTSGRNVLIENAINSVYEEGTEALFFGIGMNKSLASNDGSVAHNRFVEIFQFGGFISLILFLFYVNTIYGEIKRYKTNSFLYSINILFFILLVMSFIPSHGFPIWIDLLFGGTLAANKILYEQKIKDSIKL